MAILSINSAVLPGAVLPGENERAFRWEYYQPTLQFDCFYILTEILWIPSTVLLGDSEHAFRWKYYQPTLQFYKVTANRHFDCNIIYQLCSSTRCSSSR